MESMDVFIFLLGVYLVGTLSIMVRERFESKSEVPGAAHPVHPVIANILVVFSFFLVFISVILILVFLGGSSTGELLSYLVLLLFVAIGGTLCIIGKAYITSQRRAFYQSSLILVSSLLVLSFLGAWSIGKILSLINALLIFCLIVRTQYFRPAFYAALMLNGYMAYRI